MRTLPLIALVALSLAACKKEEAKPAEPPKPTAAVAQPAEAPKPVEAPKPAEANAAAGKRVEMAVTEDGFVPANVTLKANEPVTFVVTRKVEATCATELTIDGTDINAKLPLNQPVEIAWTPKAAGKVKFGCAMDKMIGGVLLVE